MTAAVVTDISVKEARQLLELLKQHWQNFERTLEEIIETKAWEPLGYDSFPEMWTAEMSEFTLFPELRAHVVYAYYDQGASLDDVVFGVKGIGRDRAESLKRQKGNGVPASHASLSSGKKKGWHNKKSDSTVVSQHERKLPSASGTLHVEIGVAAKARYQKVAKRVGMTVEEIARQAIKEKFEELS